MVRDFPSNEIYTAGSFKIFERVQIVEFKLESKSKDFLCNSSWIELT